MTTPLRTLIVLNNQAARAKRYWPRIQNRLKQNNCSFDVHQTTHAGDAEDRTRAALREGYQIIAVIGGDGTLSEVASGFFEQLNGDARTPALVNETAALAPLPSGTGNDFARGLLGRRASLEEWINQLVNFAQQGTTVAARRIDVLQGSVDSGAKRFICLNAATLGIGAEVATAVADQGGLMQRLSGEIRFGMAALGALARWRERRVRVAVDDQPALETTSNLIAITNGLYAGGGMKFTPAAQIDDGRLDVLVAHRATRRMILRELTRIHSGGHLANPKVIVTSGARVRIETVRKDQPLALEADGDVRGHTPAEFAVVPGQLKIVLSEER